MPLYEKRFLRGTSNALCPASSPATIFGVDVPESRVPKERLLWT